MGLRKLWELVGHRTIADGTRSRELLARHGIEFVQAEINAIDPPKRGADVPDGRLDGDHLVVALGAVSRPDLVPGLSEYGHDVWAFDGVPAAAEALRAFEGGRILVLIAGAPYPCPPAPYECAIGLHEHLSARGLRDRTELAVATLQPMLMPNAGRDGSEWIGRQLAERGISTRVGAKTARIEPDRVVLADAELSFDLLMAVPPHRPPAVVAESGLTAEHGWTAVDAGTLATSWDGVYAVGDVTLIPLPMACRSRRRGPWPSSRGPGWRGQSRPSCEAGSLRRLSTAPALAPSSSGKIRLPSSRAAGTPSPPPSSRSRGLARSSRPRRRSSRPCVSGAGSRTDAEIPILHASDATRPVGRSASENPRSVFPGSDSRKLQALHSFGPRTTSAIEFCSCGRS